jgi:hypothetical protein
MVDFIHPKQQTYFAHALQQYSRLETVSAVELPKTVSQECRLT